ncbi:MAG TPA: PD-(D/E)XK nuclease family protein [Acidimicrobiales bacterium]|nr:PD-(D/E)XK nuclease family protein [Acidimicrobiales bacterium]
MSLPLPTTLSPSKVTAFKDCGLAFRLSAIDRLPEPPSPAATKGTLVHRALELLMFDHDPGHRSRAAAEAALAAAVDEVLDAATVADLGLTRDEEAAGPAGTLEGFVADARRLIDGYFALEDPDRVRVVGTELMLSATVGGLHLRGIIDRLELDGDGGLVVTDYKTGRAPGATHEQARMIGVHFYALLCEAALGVLPSRVQLLHLREPVAISTVPSAHTIRGLRQQTTALWAAVTLACEREDFRPKPGRACSWCAYHDYCPAVGGDLARIPPPALRRAPAAPSPGGHGATSPGVGQLASGPNAPVAVPA